MTVIVSHHAMVRYLERVVGLSVAPLRRRLGGRRVTDKAVLMHLQSFGLCDQAFLRQVICSTVATAEDHPGCSGVSIGGFQYVIEKGVVVTIKPAHLPNRQNGRAKS